MKNQNLKSTHLSQLRRIENAGYQVICVYSEDSQLWNLQINDILYFFPVIGELEMFLWGFSESIKLQDRPF